MMARGGARRMGVGRLRDTAGLGTSTQAGTTRGTWPGLLSLQSLLWPSLRDNWCLGESWRFSSPCLLLCSGVLDLRWSDPWELGCPTAETLEATDLGWEELVAVFSTAWPWTNLWTWYAWKESAKHLLVRVTQQNCPCSHLISSLLSPLRRPCDDSSAP